MGKPRNTRHTWKYPKYPEIPESEKDTMGHLCFMLIFDDFVGFRVLTALSSELPQVRQNGNPEQPCLIKNALYSIIFAT